MGKSSDKEENPYQAPAMRKHEASLHHLPRTTQPALQRRAGGGMPGRQLCFLPYPGKQTGENRAPAEGLDRVVRARHSATPRVANSGGGVVGKPHGTATGRMGEILLPH